MPYLKPALYGLLAVVAVYLIRTVGRPNPADAETRHSQEILALKDSFNAAMAVRIAQESTLVKQAQRAHRDALVYAGQLRTLQERLAGATTAGDSVIVQDSMLATAHVLLMVTEQRCSAFEAALNGCTERAALLGIRLDTVEHALGRQIQVSQCELVLGINCPSRKETAAGVAALTILLMLLVTR